MGLAVAVFVPEGIVLASDGLAEIRNSESDNGFLQKKQRNLFSFQNRFLICVQGSGYIEGKSYAYYITQIFSEIRENEYCTTQDFCIEFKSKISERLDQGEQIVFYIAGIDSVKGKLSPIVYLVDKMNFQVINKSNDGKVVYNYHSIGRSVWVNKLLLQTTYEPDKNHRIEFESMEIDFSKYSLQDAIDFGRTMIELSQKMDNFAQLKQMVGENISVGYINLDNDIQISKLY